VVNYFQKFIEHYSEIAVPLTNLTKKSHPWVWTGRCQNAFELLKQKLTEAPLLRTPDESLPYEVVTDASDLGLGGMLLQEGQPVAFESRKLNDAELNYQTTEKKCLLSFMLCVCGGAIWKVLSIPCILITCYTPISRRNQTCHDGKHPGRNFRSALGLSSGSSAKEQKT
jgi:hypothetical protein